MRDRCERHFDSTSPPGRGGEQGEKIRGNPLVARLYGIMNYDMAISDTPDITYVLEMGCGVCLGKRTFFDLARRCSLVLSVCAT
jgi:hypothetical protein